MKRYIGKSCRITALALLLAVLLSGCISGSVSELYVLPKLPEDYQKLQKKIEEVLAQNSAESAAPLTGELSQPVQLQDLDGDGVKEAIAFFRVTSDERPLKIYIYRQLGEEYEVAAVIEGAGSAINCVAYENLDDTPAKEIVVSWQMSEKVYSLAAYSIAHDQVLELVRADDYTDFRVFDLDMDNQKELIVLMAGETGGSSRVDLYNFHSVLELESSAMLSQNTTSPVENGMQTGYLKDHVPAVFVPSYYSENGRITDIMAWRDGRIQNITLDPETGESSSTVRWYNQVSGTDINGDGIMELPEPYALPDPKQTTTAVNFWALRWRQFDINGTPTTVFTTYHNERDGWYFILPDQWEGKVCLSRSDQAGGSERAVIFSYWEEGSGMEPEPFLVIYRLTGENRERRADMAGRFRLYPPQREDNNVIYAGRLLDCSWDSGLTEESVQAAFSLISGS
jgi:hypothetical protein